MEPKTFAELSLSPKVLAAIESAGYSNPTPIQEAAIPVACKGHDILGIAQTGTGKTASFTLPMITRLESGRARARMPRSLILAPTRELAAQVAQSFEKYGVNHKLSLALLIGGVSFDEQFKKLDRGVDVLIATPGRLLDHFQRGKLMLMGVEILVIDEADRMLDMGFIPDIEKICKLLPPRRQTLFFSATMPTEIQRLVDQFLKNPVQIEVAPPATTAKTITQKFCYCGEAEDWDKRETLRGLIRGAGDTLSNAIIFANRKRDVAILLKSLQKHGFNAGALHGDMDQKSRMETLDQFRSGDINILAASDVAARGLDIPDVSHVFNYDLPWQSDDYVHRIGRTGRAGREGNAASLVTIDDLKIIKEIEKLNGETLAWDGEEPAPEDYENSGRKRRGRGRRGSGNGDRKSSSERGSRGRGGRSGGRNKQATKSDDKTVMVADQPAESPSAATEPVNDAPQSQDAQTGERQEKPARKPRSRGGRGRRRSGQRDDQAANANEHTTATAARPVSMTSPDAPKSEPANKTFNRSGQKQQGVGFTENTIPAFLRRPVRRPTKTSETTE